MRWHALGFGVIGWVFLCVWHGLDNVDALPSSVMLRRAWQLMFSAQIWLAIVAVLGFARRHLNRDNAARRYLTTAVFPVYILHQTVIVVADHQKFGRYAPVHVHSLDRAHYLVTDREPEADMAETLSPLAVEVLVATAEAR